MAVRRKRGMTTAPVMLHIQARSSGTLAPGLNIRPIPQPFWITS
jgi:hypothetical protein